MTDEQRRPTPIEMARVFLKIGTLGFGGGIAMIALLERECVRRRRWIDYDAFLHGMGLGQILGPMAVNAALFIGYQVYGVAGGVLAAAAMLAPSLVMVIVLSWFYFAFHRLPSLQGALAGIGPVVIALIVHAALILGRRTLRSWPAAALGALGAGACLAHVNPILALAVAGGLGLALRLDSPRGGAHTAAAREEPDEEQEPQRGGDGPDGPALVALAATAPGLAKLCWVFFKIGFIFFGGGYVLIPLLHQRLVQELGWLSAREFLDGVAISQLTPGPIAVLATFVGYRVAGVAGALLGTAALFLPSMALMLFIAGRYRRMSHMPRVRDFLAGVSAAVVGFIGATAVILMPGSLHWSRPGGWVLGLAALAALSWRQWPPAALLAIGAVLGVVFPGMFA